jgi:uncharacterized protein YggL (DUF469 family)
MSAACPALGFSVRVTFANAAGADTRRECERAFHAMLDARGLTYRGDENFVIIQSEASQATETDRIAVRDWCGARREIAAVDVGVLVDLRDE